MFVWVTFRLKLYSYQSVRHSSFMVLEFVKINDRKCSYKFCIKFVFFLKGGNETYETSQLTIHHRPHNHQKNHRIKYHYVAEVSIIRTASESHHVGSPRFADFAITWRCEQKLINEGTFSLFSCSCYSCWWSPSDTIRALYCGQWTLHHWTVQQNVRWCPCLHCVV
jgi:hypothetical protein